MHADVDESLGDVDGYCCTEVPDIEIDVDDPFDIPIVNEFLVVPVKSNAGWSDDVGGKKSDRIFFQEAESVLVYLDLFGFGRVFEYVIVGGEKEFGIGILFRRFNKGRQAIWVGEPIIVVHKFDPSSFGEADRGVPVFGRAEGRWVFMVMQVKVVFVDFGCVFNLISRRVVCDDHLIIVEGLLPDRVEQSFKISRSFIRRDADGDEQMNYFIFL